MANVITFADIKKNKDNKDYEDIKDIFNNIKEIEAEEEAFYNRNNMKLQNGLEGADIQEIARTRRMSKEKKKAYMDRLRRYISDEELEASRQKMYQMEIVISK